MPTSGLRMLEYCLNYNMIPHERVNEVDIIHILYAYSNTLIVLK